MKIGFLTACLPDMGLTDLAGWASQAGFKALELAAWPVQSDRDYKSMQIDAAHFTKEDAERVRGLMESQGMSVSALAYYDNNLHPDLKLREAYLEHLRKVIHSAALLKVDRVGTFVGGRPDRTPTENVKEIGVVFREIVRFAEDQGVKVMIENCPMEHWVKFGTPGNFAFSPELWEVLFNEVKSDSFGLNLDPSHLFWLGIDSTAAVKDFAPKIFHVHAKDTEILQDGKRKYGIFGRQVDPVPWKSGWWRYRIPGLGEIDWRRFIDALRDCGYSGVISIEHEDPVWEGSEEKIKKGLELGLGHLSKILSAS
ncbi:sugar phosphate isomerase/epimerase [bacterium]|nr:sugar phosphate isomerase/epimerase [bacterium]